MELMKEFKSVKELKRSYAQQLGVDPETLTAPAWALSGYLTDYEKILFQHYAPDVLKYHGAFHIQYYYNFGYVITDQKGL